jgi:hypothetical protein
MLKLHKVVLVLFKLAVYFGIYFVFRELVRFLSPGLADSIAFLLTMLLIITNRGKLTELIQKGVDKSFYHTLYRLKEAARSFNRELDFSIEYDVLLHSLFTLWMRLLKPVNMPFMFIKGAFSKI